MSIGDDDGWPKREWYERGPDKRTREHWDHTAGAPTHQRTGGTTFPRLYVKAFGIAALLGLACGVVVVLAGLWHFHVRPLW